ncbi:MAG: hypothetical protein AAGA75_20600 [Cyanobacteria bacterium P01_E01_bin.6]
MTIPFTRFPELCQVVNSRAIAVIGAMDNDTESNGADALVTSGQL